MRNLYLLLFALLLAILVISCDNRSLDVEEFTIANVTVSTDTIIINSGGSQNESTIVATIVDDHGLAAEGEYVKFSTDLGQVIGVAARTPLFNEVSVETDIEGIATVYLYEQDEPGVASVKIKVYGDSKTVQVVIIQPE